MTTFVPTLENQVFDAYQMAKTESVNLFEALDGGFY